MVSVLGLKKELANAIRVLARGEILTLLFGHASVRVPGENRFLMPGHIHQDGKLLTDMDENDIITVGFDGVQIEGRISAPGERFIHSEIYKARPDVGGIVHAHPVLSIAFSVSGTEIVPVEHRAVGFGPKVRILDLPEQIDTPELGARVAEALGSNLAILLRGHGNVVVGPSLADACANAFTLERNALIQLTAHTIGTGVKVIKAEEVRCGRGFSSAWPYYLKVYGDEQATKTSQST
ncbi:MAG: class II aldolase/adducin family protein [Firmicutes bacterium]|jgi:L-fuculose-phosphate aldolase|nr:class II aldolase/adducin family protein [Bacillota bacterium]